MATREPTEAWTDTTAPEVRRLVEAAEWSHGRDSIGHQAVASLLSRGFPDALLVPPLALEAFRDANVRRRLWIPFVIHFGLVAVVVLAASLSVVYELLHPPERQLPTPACPPFDSASPSWEAFALPSR